MNKAFLFPLLLLLLFSCGEKKVVKPLSELQTTFRIDPNIKHDTVFRLLNTLPEVYSFLEKVEPNAKKSSNVHFYYGKDAVAKGDYLSSYINARAYKLNKDSLVVSISVADGYSGYGLTILLEKDHFSTAYYTFTDALSSEDKEPENITLAQDLVLNQSDYALNDSIYGYINFQSQYIDQRSDTTIVNAKGHFRAKVQEMER